MRPRYRAAAPSDRVRTRTRAAAGRRRRARAPAPPRPATARAATTRAAARRRRRRRVADAGDERGARARGDRTSRGAPRAAGRERWRASSRAVVAHGRVGRAEIVGRGSGAGRRSRTSCRRGARRGAGRRGRTTRRRCRATAPRETPAPRADVDRRQRHVRHAPRPAAQRDDAAARPIRPANATRPGAGGADRSAGRGREIDAAVAAGLERAPRIEPAGDIARDRRHQCEEGEDEHAARLCPPRQTTPARNRIGTKLERSRLSAVLHRTELVGPANVNCAG